ncbi:MAG: ABC transporter substrate-binding protein, partial [Oscillospiraceae bacterium]|nr:ABC transporter substrate-binding protein [Oscillospiraceae bacterium]
LLTLCGCTFNKQNDMTSEKADTVTFTDDLKREVTVSKNPQKVAALIGSFADVWNLAGGSVCAAPDDAWSDFGLDIDGAVNIGGAHSPSLELLLSAEPDFVIASASTAANVDMKEVLENAKITVAYFDVDCFEDYLDMLDICTDITGRKDLYEKNGLNIKNKIEKIKENMEGNNIPDEQKTVLLLRASAGFVKAKNSEGTVLGEMLSDLGCINIADSDKSLLENLSIESILKSDPYRIFIVTMGDDTDAARNSLSRIMKENPAWNDIGAVKENRMYFMDKKLFNLKPNARWADAYEQLYEILQK